MATGNVNIAISLTYVRPRYLYARPGEAWREIDEADALGLLYEMTRFPVFYDGFRLVEIKH